MRGRRLCLESEAVEGERWKLPLSKFWESVLRFGQNAVKTPGRTHENHCVTKGLKFRSGIHNRGMPDGQGFFPSDKEISAAILTYGKGNRRSMAENDVPFSVCADGASH